MSGLSEDQKQEFAKTRELLKLEEEFLFDVANPVFEKAVVKFSHRKEDADIVAIPIEIPSYDDLFAMLGLPNSVKDNLPEMSPVYPCEGLLIAGEELYIKAGQVIEVGSEDNPTLMVLGAITIESGGQLLVTGNTAVNCQFFTQL
jgi:hypothetical protein